MDAIFSFTKSMTAGSEKLNGVQLHPLGRQEYMVQLSLAFVLYVKCVEMNEDIVVDVESVDAFVSKVDSVVASVEFTVAMVPAVVVAVVSLTAADISTTENVSIDVVTVDFIAVDSSASIACPGDGSLVCIVGLVLFDVVSIEVISVGITVGDVVNTEAVSYFVVENVAACVSMVVPITIVVWNSASSVAVVGSCCVCVVDSRSVNVVESDVVSCRIVVRDSTFVDVAYSDEVSGISVDVIYSVSFDVVASDVVSGCVVVWEFASVDVVESAVVSDCVVSHPASVDGGTSDVDKVAPVVK